MNAGMKGLEDRLRGIATDNRGTLHSITLTAITDAADEIERLTKEYEQLRREFNRTTAADRIATLESALREADRLLNNLQPHIPQACKDGHAPFIDNYVDPAIEIVRAALAAGRGR